MLYYTFLQIVPHDTDSVLYRVVQKQLDWNEITKRFIDIWLPKNSKHNIVDQLLDR